MATPRNDPTELAPKLEIFNEADTLQKTFETTKIAASPTQDITITDIVLEIGVGNNWGKLVYIINDDSNALTKNTIRRESTIERLWRTKLQLGKTAGGLETWFDGKILETEILRPGTARQQLMVTCVGWGDVLRNRITKLIRNQDKESNGIDIDTTDTSTTIDELIMDLTNDTDHQIDDNIPILSSIVFDNTDEQKICSTCLNIQIPNVNMTYSTYASAISRLMGLANMMWYVNPARDLIARDPFAHDSGYLFTNDVGSTEEQNWTATKLGYIVGEPISWTDSAAQSFYNILHGVGPFSPLLDFDKSSIVPDSSDNLDNTWYAIPFTMTNDNIFKIAIRAIKTGTPSNEGVAELLIVGDVSGSPPDLTVNADVRRTIKLNGKTLDALGTSTPAPWFEIPIKPRLEVTPDEAMWVVFKTFGTTADTYNVNYDDSNTVNKSKTSPTGATWSDFGHSAPVRIYTGRRIEITVENINITKKLKEPREKLIPLRADMEELTARQALIAASSALGKTMRRYNAITVTAPDTLPPLLKFCKIVDAKTGLAIKANMIGLHLEMHAQSPSALGADRYTLMLEDLFV